ncbi:MAG: type I-B CRISPR-associated protein Cas8b1/Cst1 [Bacillota bacterium]|nr:type I-B CRISPR-associated protein Cas8b1/Cst1 [Bacillota bacterium]
MLNYTGHPLVDVGIATLAAFANKRDPAQLTPDDLKNAVKYMQENYVVNPLKSFLTVAFPNSGFTNPAFEKQPEKRTEYASFILNAWCHGVAALNEPCVYTRQPAVLRAFRQHLPLITGEEIINFHPYGMAGLPISGGAILAVQAFPLGCAKVQGRLLAVHADDSDLTYSFAQRFLEQNREAIQTAQLSGSSKLPESPRSAATLLLETLLEIEEERLLRMGGDMEEQVPPVSITAYHLSNLGQNVDLAIYHLPLEIFDFLRTAISARYRAAWGKIRQRGWEIVRAKRTRKADTQEPLPRYNVLYEDLFRLPEQALHFIRCYFLRVPTRARRAGDPRATYSLKAEADLVSWDLVDLFLRKVVRMDLARIQQIRDLGDALAGYVYHENDRRFFHTFLTARRYDILREALIRVSVARIKKGQPPLVTFDPYIEIFEHGRELPDANWRLARDLVLIRMIERLYQLGWIQAHAAELPEPEDETVV